MISFSCVSLVLLFKSSFAGAIFAVVSLTVLPQNSITSSVNSRENLMSFSFHLAKNSSSWLPMDGSSSTYLLLLLFLIIHYYYH